MRKIVIAGLGLVAAWGAVGEVQAFDLNKHLNSGKVQAVSKALAVATLSDADMAKLSRQSVEFMDKKNPIAPDSDPDAQRLMRLVKGMEREDGLSLNFKVYKVKDVNAFATPDGSVRVMAGLMALMTDDELRSVIGHEIGHVKHKHSKKQYQKAYAISAAKDAALANGRGQILASGEVGNFVENVLNAKFSRSDESEADTYGFQFMVRHGYDYHAAAAAFDKLAKLSGGGKQTLMSSHPDSKERAKIAKKRAVEQDAKGKR